MTTIKPGFYPADQLPNEKYHSGPGVSQSGLKWMDVSPADYKAYVDGRKKSSQTAGKFMGTAVHAAALEPHVFDEEYVVAPSEFKDRRTKGFKAWSEEQDPRQTILMPAEYERVAAMRDELHAHPWVGPRLRGATCELSCYAEDPETGVLCRVRFDMVTEGGMILDLKKTQSVADRDIAKSIANYGYYMQNAFYLDVPGWLGEDSRPDGFAFVFIEEDAPHNIAVRFLAPEDVERGRQEYRRLLNRYAECLESGEWPGVKSEPAFIELPKWKRTEIDERGETV